MQIPEAVGDVQCRHCHSRQRGEAGFRQQELRELTVILWAQLHYVAEAAVKALGDIQRPEKGLGGRSLADVVFKI